MLPYDRTLLSQTTEAINAVHRRPVSLRKWQVTSAEGVLRGAKLSALIDATSQESAISVYSLLSPELISSSASTFLRAPLQILAKMDVLAGGDGKPVNSVSGLQQLAAVVQSRSEVLASLVHASIVHNESFGARSGLIARASSRLAAVATGLDPRGLTVPEVYVNRHLAEYVESIRVFPEDPARFIDLQHRAFLQGAAEAESIAQAAR